MLTLALYVVAILAQFDVGISSVALASFSPKFLSSHLIPLSFGSIAFVSYTFAAAAAAALTIALFPSFDIGRFPARALSLCQRLALFNTEMLFFCRTPRHFLLNIFQY